MVTHDTYLGSHQNLSYHPIPNTETSKLSASLFMAWKVVIQKGLKITIEHVPENDERLTMRQEATTLTHRI